jgi:hypothetical protein
LDKFKYIGFCNQSWKEHIVISCHKEGYSAYYPSSGSNFKSDIDHVTGYYCKTLEPVFHKKNVKIINIEAL